MRRLLFLSLMTSLVSSVTMADTTVSHFLLRDKSAGATFFSTDTTTCAAGIETFVSVQGGFSALKDGSTTEIPFASVIMSVFDFCRGAVLLDASGNTDTLDLRINPSLKSASLQATVSLNNFVTGQAIYATVDLVWNGAGKADRTSSNTVDHSGGVTVTSFSQGAIREAEAAGSVVVGSTDYTPEPSFDGFIERDATRETTITHQ